MIYEGFLNRWCVYEIMICLRKYYNILILIRLKYMLLNDMYSIVFFYEGVIFI